MTRRLFLILTILTFKKDQNFIEQIKQGETKMSITVYSTPTCPWCSKAKEFFKENNVEFTDINVGENQAAAKEMVEKSGQMGVPVIDLNGEFIVGFNEPKLRELLKIK